jgi:hypothetical protein
MYIGYSQSIVEFWINIENEEDDQIFATKKCRTESSKIKIDTENKLFYNFCKKDIFQTRDNRIVFSNGQMPCFISAPGNQNINDLLTELSFNNLPKIEFQYGVRLKRYFKEFIPEICWIIISVIVFFIFSNKLVAFMICFVLFLELINYELYIKHLDNTNFIYKLIFVLMDTFHISIVVFISYLLINLECDILKLILLDSIYLIMVFLFFIFKKCILSTFENRVLGIDDEYNSISRETRLNYFFDINADYYPKIGNNTMNWMNGNIVIAFLIASLNIFCLWKIYNKSCVITNKTTTKRQQSRR